MLISMMNNLTEFTLFLLQGRNHMNVRSVGVSSPRAQVATPTNGATTVRWQTARFPLYLMETMIPWQPVCPRDVVAADDTPAASLNLV